MPPSGLSQGVPLATARLSALAAHDEVASTFAGHVVDLALETLPRTVLTQDRVCFTLRGGAGRGRAGRGAVAEGTSLRYAAIVALGAALLSEPDQTRALRGSTAADLVARAADDLGARPDLGDLAMTAWAAVELDAPQASSLVALLVPAVRSASAPSTVSAAWALTALVADGQEGPAHHLATALMDCAGPSGLFPHWLHPAQAPRLRRHVGCFADQVYPLQALARYAQLTGDAQALAAAQRCADSICRLQGPEGQWWWHYDVRTGGVVEGYPVYAVHQAGMAPMALLDLAAAGGTADLAAVTRGLRWLAEPAAADGPLVDEDERLVWRKVARREPLRKGVRSLRSVATAASPSLHLSALDRAFPPGPVDHESRPYEAGWALYAWLRSP